MSQQIKDMLTCPICRSIFTSALSLPCSHTFCKSCIQYRNVQIQSKNKLCPVCKANYSIDQVYDNVALQNIADCIKQHQNNRPQMQIMQINSSFFKSDITDVQYSDKSIQYSEQSFEKPNFTELQYDQEPTNEQSQTEEIISESSSYECSQHEDIFHQPVYKCKTCQKYVKSTKRKSHEEKCITQCHSTFGLATMPRQQQCTSSQKKRSKNMDSKKKQISDNYNSDAQYILNLGDVTLSTSITKIKNDLAIFGFKKQYINQLTKGNQCKIYNQYIKIFKAYINDSKGHKHDVEGLKVMICDEILKDITESRNKPTEGEYLQQCRQIFWNNMIQNMSQEYRKNLLQRMKRNQTAIEERKKWKQEIIDIKSQQSIHDIDE